MMTCAKNGVLGLYSVEDFRRNGRESDRHRIGMNKKKKTTYVH